MKGLVPVTVVSLGPFLKRARNIGLSEDEIQEIETEIAYLPVDGDVVEGAGGIRKRRIVIPGRNKGKSGGGRVFTLFIHAQITVYIVAMLDKSDVGNLTKEQLHELAVLAESLKFAQRRRLQ